MINANDSCHPGMIRFLEDTMYRLIGVTSYLDEKYEDQKLIELLESAVSSIHQVLQIISEQDQS